MATLDHSTSTSNDKQVIQNGYDLMAASYTAWSLKHSKTRLEYVDDLLARLPTKHSTVLELGCGAGTPVLEYLVQHVDHVIANDISNVQLEAARAHCPEKTTFLPGDMMRLEIAPESLDAVAAFYSILHLPREEQKVMFGHIWRWLKDGGFVVLNLGTVDREALRGEFFGQEMFWSGFDVETSKKMVRDAGFELLKAEVLEASEDLEADDPDYGISFLWMVARKSAAGSV